MPSVNAQKTWHLFRKWEYVHRSSWAQQIVFRLPSYDPPRVAPFNKAKFHIYHRHAVGEVCEQRMTALQT